MGRWLIIAFACLGALAAAARAAGYDDFARGMTANNTGESAIAVDAFTAAIGAADLSPNLLPTAYRGRGLAYLRLDKCSLAIADFDKALALKPIDIDAQAYRSSARGCTGDFAGAIADASAMITARGDGLSYRQRGIYRFASGDFVGAAEDFAKGHDLIPAYPYLVLWQAMALARAGMLTPAAAEADWRGLKTEEWPRPVVALYAGKGTVDQVYSGIAQKDGGPTVAAQQCEADFYVGEWWLAQKNAAAARPLFQKAVSQCPAGFVERGGARNELRLLK